MKVCLILNTRIQSNEFEVEYDPPHTIELIKHGIISMGHEYSFIEADENVIEKLRQLKPDLVFNRAEGIKGESRESHIPAILEMLGIPYIGAGVLSTAVCLNKAWTKKVLVYHGIPTAKFIVFETIDQIKDFDIPFPVILKPIAEGSSIGISEDNVVNSIEQLRKKLSNMLDSYHESILVEQFIKGREFSIGVLGRSDKKEPEVLPIVEIDFSKFPKEINNVFGQKAKTVLDAPDYYICPANIANDLQTYLEDLTLKICRILDVKDFARLDYRMNSEGQVFFLDINPLPGMDFDLENDDFSFYPFMAMKAGYSYDELVARLIKSAYNRYQLNC